MTQWTPTFVECVVYFAALQLAFDVSQREMRHSTSTNDEVRRTATGKRVVCGRASPLHRSILATRRTVNDFKVLPPRL
jgi:hypothetical protein